MTAISFRHLGREVTFDPEVVSPSPLDERSFPNISSLAIDVSGCCNLKCVYCAESSTMPERPAMRRKVLKQAIDALFTWSKRGSGVSLHLGSGEPLLRPRSVREIGLRARRISKRYNRPLALYLTTNGTLLNEGILNWLIKDGWNVKVSLDGDEKIHDLYRVDREGRGTFKTIEKAVRDLAVTITKRFSTTSVLCHGTDPSKAFYGIASMGVKRIELVPVASFPTSKFALREDDMEVYRCFIFEYAERIARGEEVPTHIRFHNRLLKVMGYRNSRIPCGAGRVFFAAGPEGNLYPCFRFVAIQKYRLGDLNGIIPERVEWFARGSGRSYERRTECAKCWAAPLCGGPCFASAELFGSGSPLPSYCEMVRAESEAAIWLADVLREKNPQRLVQLMGIQL